MTMEGKVTCHGEGLETRQRSLTEFEAFAEAARLHPSGGCQLDFRVGVPLFRGVARWRVHWRPRGCEFSLRLRLGTACLLRRSVRYQESPPRQECQLRKRLSASSTAGLESCLTRCQGV